MPRNVKGEPIKGRVGSVGMSAESRTLGSKTFAAITAVEGLSISTASSKRLANMRKRKLSTGEQRAEVIRAYTSNK